MLSIIYREDMPDIQPPEDQWTTFVLSVFAMNSLIIQAGEQIVAPLGQSSARWQVLGRVFEPRTVAEIAREIGHARQSTQRVTDALVADGLVEYSPHPSDRRTQLVQLTARGQDVLKAIYARQLAWWRTLAADLDSLGLTEATALLGGIAHRLESTITPVSPEPTPKEGTP